MLPLKATEPLRLLVSNTTHVEHCKCRTLYVLNTACVKPCTCRTLYMSNTVCVQHYKCRTLQMPNTAHVEQWLDSLVLRLVLLALLLLQLRQLLHLLVQEAVLVLQDAHLLPQPFVSSAGSHNQHSIKSVCVCVCVCVCTCIFRQNHTHEKKSIVFQSPLNQ